MIRRLAVSLAFLIAFTAVAIPCWIALHRTDLPAVNDADLTVPISEIPPAQNGFEYFVEAAELLDWPRDADERLRAIRAGEQWYPEWVQEMSTRNGRAMESLHRGIGALEFQLPPDQEGFEHELFDTLIDVQRLLKLSGAQARLQLAAGDYEDAIESALLGLRSGRRISSGQGIELLGLMFATAHQGIGLADLDHVVRVAPFTRESSRKLIVELEAQRWSGADWKRTWAAEYRRLKGSFEELDADYRSGETHDSMEWAWRLLPPNYLWQLNRTLFSLAEIYRERQQRATLNCREAYPAVADYNDERRLRIAKVLLSPNPVGGLILEIATPNFDRFDLKRCHTETKFSLVQALIAVKAHDEETGSLPAVLDDLVPRYLDRVPEDRFDGAPLRYSRERKVVYSVGEDFTDSGGGDDFDLHNAAEPALPLAF